MISRCSSLFYFHKNIVLVHRPTWALYTGKQPLRRECHVTFDVTITGRWNYNRVISWKLKMHLVKSYFSRSKILHSDFQFKKIKFWSWSAEVPLVWKHVNIVVCLLKMIRSFWIKKHFIIVNFNALKICSVCVYSWWTGLKCCVWRTLLFTEHEKEQ